MGLWKDIVTGAKIATGIQKEAPYAPPEKKKEKPQEVVASPDQMKDGVGAIAENIRRKKLEAKN